MHRPVLLSLQSIAEQLLDTDDVDLDFDQILA